MVAVSGSIPNLIGGVSQQPPEIRALNSSTSLVNSWSSVVSGLGTRPGTEWIADVGEMIPEGITAATHGIAKASGRYKIIVANGAVSVVNLATGATEPVTVEGGADAYLDVADAATLVRFSTIGDTTFILNRNVVVQKTHSAEGAVQNGLTEDGVVRRNPNLRATHWVKQSAGYACNFNLYLNGALVGTSATDQSPEVAASEIRAGLTTAGIGYETITDTITSIVLAEESHWVAATDGFGDQATFAFNDYVDEFTDLPNLDAPGRLVLIKQDAGEDGDDYWVWRKGGSWEETYGWNAHEALVASTLPVALIDNRDGTWTLRRYDWKGRTVGDADSNPTPSFVGHKISDMFRFKGRLVFLADENVIMSQKGTLENFYRTTCVQLIDEDRIDIAASESRGASLVGARPFDGGLLVFSSTDQFMLKGDQDGMFSPNTVDMQPVNTYTASDALQPIGVGPNVVFVDDPSPETAQFSQLREYQVERVFGQQVALSITDQIPEYIPAGVFRMLSVSSENAVVIATKGAPHSLFCYNYYYNNDGKVQSSWQRWDYRFRVLNAVLVDDAMFILGSDNGRMFVLRQRFSEGVSPILGEEDILLDQRLSSDEVSTVYLQGRSVVTVPYEAADWSRCVAVIAPGNAGKYAAGRVFYADEAATLGSEVSFKNGDLTGEKFFIGFTFDFEWVLSPLFYRDDKMVVVQDGRLQLSRVGILYNKSGPFDVLVTPPGRDTYEKPFTGFIVGSSEDTLNTFSLDDGKARFAAPGQSDRVNIKIVGSTPWRVRFSSLEWSGKYRPKTRRTN